MSILGPAGAPGSLRTRTFEVIFGSQSRSAKIFDSILLAAILGSVGAITLESTQATDSAAYAWLRSVEIAFTLIFTIEYVLRLWCVDRPGRYALSFFGVVDLVSIAPTYLVLLFPGSQAFGVARVLRVMRIFRVFKLARYSRAASLVGTAVRASRHKIAVFMVAVVTIMFVVGSLMYLIEGPENGFTSIPKGVYWAIITLTTVGHGSLMPMTPLGQALASILMILGYGVVAIPTGIITAEVAATNVTRRQLLEGTETSHIEYKSSAYYSYREGVPERVILHSALKTIAGFLNAGGGTLAIGVSDHGKILGIQPDLDLKKMDTDRYVNALTTAIGNALGALAATMATVKVQRLDDQEICLVEVQASPDPIYMRTSATEREFYVRINNSTRRLKGPDLVGYVIKRWS